MALRCSRKAAAASLILLAVMLPKVADATLIDHGSFTTDTVTGLDWLDMTASVNMSYVGVSTQLGPSGTFAGYRYATVNEVESLWTDAGIIPGTPEPCTPSPACFAANVSSPAVQNLTALMGDTWPASYGFQGMIGLTSTPYSAPAWPGCDPYLCYVTPELRLYQSIPSEALVIEGLRNYIADPAYGSWLVRPTSVPEPGSLVMLASALACLSFFGLCWRTHSNRALPAITRLKRVARRDGRRSLVPRPGRNASLNAGRAGALDARRTIMGLPD